MRHQLRGTSGDQLFFRGRLDGGARQRQEVFYLAYHLHWSHTEIMSLELAERRAYVAMLARRIDAENEAVEELGERLRRG
jgi:hypothetical protein